MSEQEVFGEQLSIDDFAAMEARKPYLQDEDLTLYCGDALAVLRELPDESVDCCVTSPPYWGLRDYGTGAWEGGDEGCDHARPTTTYNQDFNERWGQGSGERKQEKKSQGQYAGTCPKCGARRIDQQLGLEPTPEEYVTHMVEVFREVRRVLASHGTVWLNLGDSYVSTAGSLRTISEGGKEYGALNEDGADGRLLNSERQRFGKAERGLLKTKDLVGIPWRVAFALQADGWYLRSDIIWSKPNPMPESVKDRPTKAHEYVFLLSKQLRYFFDQEAVREPHESTRWGGPTITQPPDTKYAEATAIGFAGAASALSRPGREWNAYPEGGRNIRTVWEIPTQPYPEAHFATFPEELAKRAVVAGCALEVCVQCGNPRERIVDVSYENPGSRTTNGPRSIERRHLKHGSAGFGVRLERRAEMAGWTDCGCAYGLEPDATEIIETPLGSGREEDPSLEIGRAGFSRPRREDEGTRPITRYEQREYASQMRGSPARPQMEAEAGEAFAHYIRTDRSGARPLSPELLDAWLERKWLIKVLLPERLGTNYRAGVVLDPFLGSGTVAVVARREKRHVVGIDLSAEYLDLAKRRMEKWWKTPSRSRPPAALSGQEALFDEHA